MTQSNFPQLKSAEAVAVLPERADTARLEYIHRGMNEPPPRAMFVVKLYLQEHLPATGQGFALYIDNEWIRKYFAFIGGIFFNVYTLDFFTKHAGAMIRFTSDHETFQDSGVRLPALAGNADAALQADSSALPTKRQALSD